MKRINSFATILLIAAMPILFTSCDDDDWDYYDYYGDWYNNYNWYTDSFDFGTSTLNAEAQCLRGHWTGTLINEYTADDGSREQAKMNADIEFDQYDSNSLNGRGREIDYVGNESQELRFAWYIDPRNGDIYIKYDKSGYEFRMDYNSKEEGFYLDDNQFNGIANGQNNNEALAFDLTRTTLAKPSSRAIVKSDTSTVAMKFRKR